MKFWKLVWSRQVPIVYTSLPNFTLTRHYSKYQNSEKKNWKVWNSNTAISKSSATSDCTEINYIDLMQRGHGTKKTLFPPYHEINEINEINKTDEIDEINETKAISK